MAIGTILFILLIIWLICGLVEYPKNGNRWSFDPDNPEDYQNGRERKLSPKAQAMYDRHMAWQAASDAAALRCAIEDGIREREEAKHKDLDRIINKQIS